MHELSNEGSSNHDTRKHFEDAVAVHTNTFSVPCWADVEVGTTNLG